VTYFSPKVSLMMQVAQQRRERTSYAFRCKLVICLSGFQKVIQGHLFLG